MKEILCEYAGEVSVGGALVDCTANSCPYETKEFGKARTEGKAGAACLKCGWVPRSLAEAVENELAEKSW